VTEIAAQNLDGIALLASLTPEARRSIKQKCRWHNFQTHQQIFDQRSNSRDVYFVVKGRVRVVNYSAAGKEISFADIGEGGHFGELAALDGQPRSANVIAESKTLVAVVSLEAFSELVTEHPKVAMLVMRRLAQIVRQADERIMDLSTLAANNRVHGELLRLANEYMADENSAVIAPPPTQADVASRVSAARETVARVFGDLARSGIIERKDKALHIHDVPRLSQLVQQVRGTLRG